MRKIKEGQRNELADWIFCRLTDILNDQDVTIKVVFGKLMKKAPIKIGKEYIGHLGQKEISDDGIQLITIEPRMSERTKMRVFCHELLHILHEDINDEKPIENLELILWPLLSENQKQLLREYMYVLAKK